MRRTHTHFELCEQNSKVATIENEIEIGKEDRYRREYIYIYLFAMNKNHVAVARFEV